MRALNSPGRQPGTHISPTVNPFTAVLAAPSSGKRPITVPNLKFIKAPPPPYPHPLSNEHVKTSIQIHGIQSRFAIGPSNILFAGVHLCTIQPGNFTGWGRDGVKETHPLLTSHQINRLTGSFRPRRPRLTSIGKGSDCGLDKTQTNFSHSSIFHGYILTALEDGFGSGFGEAASINQQLAPGVHCNLLVVL